MKHLACIQPDILYIDKQYQNNLYIYILYSFFDLCQQRSHNLYLQRKKKGRLLKKMLCCALEQTSLINNNNKIFKKVNKCIPFNYSKLFSITLQMARMMSSFNGFGMMIAFSGRIVRIIFC